MLTCAVVGHKPPNLSKQKSSKTQNTYKLFHFPGVTLNTQPLTLTVLYSERFLHAELRFIQGECVYHTAKEKLHCRLINTRNILKIHCVKNEFPLLFSQ